MRTNAQVEEYTYTSRLFLQFIIEHNLFCFLYMLSQLFYFPFSNVWVQFLRAPLLWSWALHFIKTHLMQTLIFYLLLSDSLQLMSFRKMIFSTMVRGCIRDFLRCLIASFFSFVVQYWFVHPSVAGEGGLLMVIHYAAVWDTMGMLIICLISVGTVWTSGHLICLGRGG